MNNSDKSLYQIPYSSEAPKEPALEKPRIKIAYDLPKQMPLKPVKQIQKTALPQRKRTQQVNIFDEMFAKSAQILYLRNIAEEEIRNTHFKYTRKSFLKKAKKHESNQLYYKYLFNQFKKNPQDISRALIDLESKVGAQICGPIYHEEWIDGKRKVHQNTTRYELRKDQVIKVEAGPHYFELKGAELRNFHHAIQNYYQNVSRIVYGK